MNDRFPKIRKAIDTWGVKKSHTFAEKTALLQKLEREETTIEEFITRVSQRIRDLARLAGRSPETIEKLRTDWLAERRELQELLKFVTNVSGKVLKNM